MAGRVTGEELWRWFLFGRAGKQKLIEKSKRMIGESEHLWCLICG